MGTGPNQGSEAPCKIFRPHGKCVEHSLKLFPNQGSEAPCKIFRPHGKCVEHSLKLLDIV